jgi:hypothetical protein
VALLLPFVWLACESAQKPSGNAPTTGLLRLSAVSA